MAQGFDAIAEDFFRLAHGIIWCTVVTVDGKGRPRSRILHPIWEIADDRPVGWVATAKTAVKARHLAANPAVAFSYWSPAQHSIQGQATAGWEDDPDTKQHVWDLFTTTPAPLGYDLRMFVPRGPRSEAFTVLRLTPHRIQIFDGANFPADLTPTVAVLS
jgi:general stress protein 26